MRFRWGGWRDVAAGGVRLFSLPMSPRGSLVEPYAKQLAGMLRVFIDAALTTDDNRETLKQVSETAEYVHS